MQKNLAESELILSPEGRIYHLHLLPEELADTIITVGDPGRVPHVSQHFDRIDFQTQHREIVSHTGIFNNKRLTVLSTGMGTPTLDIVINELDALVNIDFKAREVKPNLRSLQIIRMGTAGCFQREITVGSFVVSEFAIGMDNLMHYYQYPMSAIEMDLQTSIAQHLPSKIPRPYVVSGSDALIEKFKPRAIPGITVTCAGFYGPQDRHLRAKTVVDSLETDLMEWEYQGHRALNFEMETSAIYGLSKVLGHQACSLSVLVNNRQSGEFVKDIGKVVDDLILFTLERLTA